MFSRQLVAFPAVLSAVLGSVLASGIQPRDGSTPHFPYDENTTSRCSFWLDNDGSFSCEDTLSLYGISLESFMRWNPSVTASCGNFVKGHSYCAFADDSSQGGSPSSTEVESTTKTIPASTAAPITTTMSTSTSTSTSSKKTSTSTSTKPSNGITTPVPTQPQMVSNCNAFYMIKRGDQCQKIADQHGISLHDFVTWNPAAGETCGGLWADAYACVSVIGFVPTPTTPHNGIETPQPTQPGLIDNCVKFHYISSTDTCASISGWEGISTADFAKWNPNVGNTCTGLWANANACVGIAGFSLKTRYHRGCKGSIHNNAAIAVGQDYCMDTGCQAGSLEIDAEGACPDGQIQLSYWEKPGCRGKWFGYGYANKGTCRGLWTDGTKFQAIHLRCAKKANDCSSRGTCTYDAEPHQAAC